MITRYDAIKSLRPTAEFILTNDSLLEWIDANQTEPTDAEIQSEIKRLEAEHAATQYQRDRKEEYPSIEECVHAMLDGKLDALQAIRAEIKTKYPKP